jgi:fluoride ion exporter CrcB/FEX
MYALAVAVGVLAGLVLGISGRFSTGRVVVVAVGLGICGGFASFGAFYKDDTCSEHWECDALLPVVFAVVFGLFGVASGFVIYRLGRRFGEFLGYWE